MAAPLSTKLEWNLANPIWASTLNPIVANPILSGKAVDSITLTANTPLTINHGLARNQVGWFITDQVGAASVARTKPLNSLTLTLEATAATVITLWVY